MKHKAILLWLVCFLGITTICQAGAKKRIEKIDRWLHTFVYVESNEYALLKRNDIAKTITELRRVKKEAYLQVLAEVWVCYSRDSSLQNLAYSVLNNNRMKSIKAINERIANRKSWEKPNDFHIIELKRLIEQLEKEYNQYILIKA